MQARQAALFFIWLCCLAGGGRRNRQLFVLPTAARSTPAPCPAAPYEPCEVRETGITAASREETCMYVCPMQLPKGCMCTAECRRVLARKDLEPMLQYVALHACYCSCTSCTRGGGGTAQGQPKRWVWPALRPLMLLCRRAYYVHLRARFIKCHATAGMYMQSDG